MKQRKKPHPYLSKARAFWRVSMKKRRDGDYRGADWYTQLGDRALKQYHRHKDYVATNINVRGKA